MGGYPQLREEHMKHIFLYSLIVGFILLGLAFPGQSQPIVQAEESPTGYSVFLPFLVKAPTTLCRFGITAIPGQAGYDVNLAPLKVGAFIDWSPTPSRTLPGDVEYIHVINVGGDAFNDASRAAAAAALAAANKGDYWQVGNEPDTSYYGQAGVSQDNITAETYGHRYKVIAEAIKAADPTAKIGFGSIVQPTPIRLRYLDRAWITLLKEVDSYAAVDQLIDFWSIHAFILNETGGWGTGIPKGFEDDNADAITITNLADTYSIDLFKQRVQAMRRWMRDRGQQNKPLWITEYGSLFPPIDPPGGPNYVNVSDTATANFMVQTFDYLNSATSPSMGMPADGNRLVQRWFWYSLNDHRYYFGGTLYDPDNGAALTAVGSKFINYVAPLAPAAGCMP